jgi:hypothetical protein
MFGGNRTPFGTPNKVRARSRSRPRRRLRRVVRRAPPDATPVVVYLVYRLNNHRRPAFVSPPYG